MIHMTFFHFNLNTTTFIFYMDILKMLLCLLEDHLVFIKIKK